MKVIVDAFGGDFAPYEVVFGAVKALNENENLRLVLVGDKDKITEILQQLVFVSDRLEIVHAPDVISMEEEPTLSFRTKKTSSIVVAFDYLKNNDDAVALVSAGNTGTTLTGSVLKLGRIDKIKRPALAAILPNMKGGKTLLLDCGANADCKPEYLFQFALMGSEYLKAIGVKKPRIALLNIGTEDEKGDELHKKAYQYLNKSKLNFVGNIESRDVMRGNVDVIVADGFSGNICLKSCEGIAEVLFDEIKEEVNKSFKAKLGLALLKNNLKSIKNKYDYTKYGGAPLLGVNKIVLKCHGNSKSETIKETILQAEQLAEKKLIEKIKEVIGQNEV